MQTEKVPEGGEEAFGKTLKKERLGYNPDVTLLGIYDDNPYFDAKVENGPKRSLFPQQSHRNIMSVRGMSLS